MKSKENTVMERMSSVFVSLIVVIAFSMGCSVKEDRSVCPCVMMLDFSGVDPDRTDSLVMSVLSADGFIHKDTVFSDSFAAVCEVPVPRGGVQVNIYSAENGQEDFSWMMDGDGASLEIPLGNECPAVNMFSRFVDTGAESVYVPVALGKNYCNLTIRLLTDGQTDLWLSVEGNICGYSRNGAPMAGNFSVTPEMDAEGYCSVRIPRQTDSSLRLVISDEDGILREFAVGEYIVESGYDWSAYDLEDVEIDIDYSKAEVTFVINDWEMTFDINVEI